MGAQLVIPQVGREALRQLDSAFPQGIQEPLELSVRVGLVLRDGQREAGAVFRVGYMLQETAHIPVEDGSADLLTSLFALTLPEEFSRVLAKDGLYFQVLAAQDHLLGLKSIIYPELKLKEKDSVPELPGFERIQTIPVRFTFAVEGEQVQNLLSMTPHVYRISREGAQRLGETRHLEDRASCVLNLYRPEK